MSEHEVERETRVLHAMQMAQQMRACLRQAQCRQHAAAVRAEVDRVRRLQPWYEPLGQIPKDASCIL